MSEGVRHTSAPYPFGVSLSANLLLIANGDLDIVVTLCSRGRSPPQHFHIPNWPLIASGHYGDPSLGEWLGGVAPHSGPIPP